MPNKTNREVYQLSVQDILRKLSGQYMRYEISVTELCPYGESIRLDALGFHRYNKLIKGFEIKLTRADFTSDKKWQKYLPYCNYFSFATPRGIIKKEELPDKIGLIEFWVEEFETWHEEKDLTGEDRHLFIKSEIVKKCGRLDDVDIDNYIKVLEGIALKATFKTDNLI